MRYRIGLHVFEGGRWLGGQMQWYDELGSVVHNGEPDWHRAACDRKSRQEGSIIRNNADLHVYWNGEGQVAHDGDWVARFPETGAILVLPNWLVEQLAVTAAPIQMVQRDTDRFAGLSEDGRAPIDSEASPLDLTTGLVKRI